MRMSRLLPYVQGCAVGVTLEALGVRLGAEFAATNDGWGMRAVPLADEVVGYFRPALFVLMAAVGLLLVIACVNVANLRATVDTLFEVNETVLAHRTNDRLGALTVISVSLMPPTLLASFYGMNVEGLPFADHLWVPIAVIVASLIVSLAGILLIGRRTRH